MDANYKSTTFFVALYASDPLDMVSVHMFTLTYENLQIGYILQEEEKRVKKAIWKEVARCFVAGLLLLFNTPQSLLWGFLLPPLWKRGARGDFKLIKFTIKLMVKGFAV